MLANLGELRSSREDFRAVYICSSAKLVSVLTILEAGTALTSVQSDVILCLEHPSPGEFGRAKCGGVHCSGCFLYPFNTFEYCEEEARP